MHHPRQKAIYPPSPEDPSLRAKCRSVIDVVEAWCSVGKTMVPISDIIILIKPLHDATTSSKV